MGAAEDDRKPFDLRTWDASDRSIIIREGRNAEETTYFGLLTDIELPADGNAHLVALSGEFHTGMYGLSGVRPLGAGIKEWEFCKPKKEVVDRILRNQGKLPKLIDEFEASPAVSPKQVADFGGDDDNKEHADQPGSPARVSAAKNTRPR